MNWIITTAGQTWRESASSIEEAIQRAWKVPPKHIGHLVEIKPATNADDDHTFYISGVRACQLAGFKVAEGTSD